MRIFSFYSQSFMNVNFINPHVSEPFSEQISLSRFGYLGLYYSFQWKKARATSRFERLGQKTLR
jgi:hypothetical protein